MAMEKEALTNTIESDLAKRNRNWGKVDGHLAEDVTLAHGLAYEAGDWTPRMTINDSMSGIVQSNYAKYVRVGTLVHVNGGIVISSKGTNVGVLKVAGLPFMPKVNSHGQGMGIGDIRNGILSPGYIGFCLHLIDGNDFFTIKQIQSNGHSIGLDNTNIIDGFILLFSFTYTI